MPGEEMDLSGPPMAAREGSVAEISNGSCRNESSLRPSGESLLTSSVDCDFQANSNQCVLYQCPSSALQLSPIAFPPADPGVFGAVWSWQMSSTEWIPFDLEVSAVLESIWQSMEQEELAGRAEELVSGSITALEQNIRPTVGTTKIFVKLPPWIYSIDLSKMLQQNMTTHRVRPIRRAPLAASLWFIGSNQGVAQRVNPLVEARLEELWQESDGCRASGLHQILVHWRDQVSGQIHLTDIWSMVDRVEGIENGTQQVARLELRIAPSPSSSNTSSDDVIQLPSLCPGLVENGIAYCRGYSNPLDSDELQRALLATTDCAVPDDLCAICLDAFRGEDRLVDLDISKTVESDHGNQAVDENVNTTDTGSGSASNCQRNYATVNNNIGCDVALDGSISFPPANDTGSAIFTGSNETNGVRGCSSPIVKLASCCHYFHSECIRLYLKSTSKGGFFCPTCNVLQTPGNGPSPPGRLNWRIISRSLLEGHSSEGTIVLEYNMEGGLQNDRHVHPNASFDGTRRLAYLPDCLRARQILRLLIRAFVKGHIFTVGTSVTSGRTDVIIWNGIHHKTNVAGGLLQYGYPDPTYFDRLENELQARGFSMASNSGGK